MTTLKTLAASVVVCCGLGVSSGQIRVLSNAEPLRVFCGEARDIPLTLQNSGTQEFAGEIRMVIFQTTSATTVPVSEVPWKRIHVLPGQTVIEGARIDFPQVRAETRFLIEWFHDAKRILGRTEVLVYPTNLLAELKPLIHESPLGVFDPDNQLKPLLKALVIDQSDLENDRSERFAGRLAIIGPFASRPQDPERLLESVKALAKKSVAVVWLQPPREPWDKLLPSFYSVTEYSGAVVIVQAEMVANLAENPQSQLNLVQFAQMALHPEPLCSPDTVAPTESP